MKFKHIMLTMWQIDNNYSNNKCAKLLGISCKLWSGYKSGNIAPTVYTINKLAERMGICAFDLITPRPAVACNVKKLKLKNSVLVKWQKVKGWSKKDCAEYVGIVCGLRARLTASCNQKPYYHTRNRHSHQYEITLA